MMKLSLSHHANKNFVLHLYDHCPFCVRVELTLGLRSIPYQRVIYGYGDIDGPTNKFGKKVVPVLEYTKEDGATTYIRESLDIVSFIDSLDGAKNRVLAPQTGRLNDWLENKYKPHERTLTKPRVHKLPLKDWAKEEDTLYWINKYAKQNMDFAVLLKDTENAKKEVEKALKDLEEELSGEDSVNLWGFSLDDIVLIPELRTLSCVKGVNWPQKVLNYLQANCERTGVKLYFDHAL